MDKNDLNYLNSIRKLYTANYYWGPISYAQSEKLLKDRENGSFLVRDSKNERFLFTVTYKSNDYIYHIRMQHMSNGKSIKIVFQFPSFITKAFINKGLFKFQNSNSSIEPQDIKTLIDTVMENSKTGYSYFLNRENSKYAYTVSF